MTQRQVRGPDLPAASLQNSKTFGPPNLFSKSMTVCWGLSETLCVCGRACACMWLCVFV